MQLFLQSLSILGQKGGYNTEPYNPGLCSTLRFVCAGLCAWLCCRPMCEAMYRWGRQGTSSPCMQHTHTLNGTATGTRSGAVETRSHAAAAQQSCQTLPRAHESTRRAVQWGWLGFTSWVREAKGQKSVNTRQVSASKGCRHKGWVLRRGHGSMYVLLWRESAERRAERGYLLRLHARCHVTSCAQ